MDAAYLEESLELQDIWDVIVISQGMNVVYSTSELSAMWSDGFCCMINFVNVFSHSVLRSMLCNLLGIHY